MGKNIVKRKITAHENLAYHSPRVDFFFFVSMGIGEKELPKYLLFITKGDQEEQELKILLSCDITF